MGALITAADLHVQDGVPRVEDLRLADALGFADRHMIRTLIKRHIEALERFGEVSVMRRKPGAKGGRPSTVYSLNEEQAIYITAKSDTHRAAEITVEMVRVFRDYLKGEAEADHLIPVRAHTRRRPKPGFGTIIADNNDLYPFVEEGDELVVEFTRDTGLGMGEPQSLVVALDPVSGRPRPCWLMLTGGGAFGLAQVVKRRVDGAPLPVTANFPVIGRVVGVNKPTAGERRAELARVA
ncbi:hypothetical protein [Xanthobacter sediminis]|uniref:hypothetical protein n=1 Tax=Xanthobacter sediminis TaxID=3119926 RepID=UPI00372C4FAB